MTAPEQPRALAHGQLSYLQLPATDISTSATFYATVFGWQVDPPHPSFEAPGLIGQWVDDRPPAPTAGPLLWIQVDKLAEALAQVISHNGEILEPPTADGPTRTLATIRDPAGNPIGLSQE
jgi:hypothetical protein